MKKNALRDFYIFVGLSFKFGQKNLVILSYLFIGVN